ncbi:hypothetical protein [Biformimicrobium ophioploci]|uniref:SGNH/GDSL hydrolase family protein n=1 Tax=Biformimicrobium ophioploci TaxID=3036711 RepID=A0ABQ6LXC5_9GAMM|nr:hypothetical protein [Microbulbifer sp. NKW57]GMG86769.1 hypothetical protein MNKW57_10900 [Microbulbifer sp. NKW57]
MPEDSGPERVLYVGNSLSFYNNGLHTHVTNLLKSAGRWHPGNSKQQLLTLSAGGLEESYPGLVARLEAPEGRWSAVVFHGRSSDPVNPRRQQAFREGVARFAEAISAAGAEPVLLETWAYPGRVGMTEAVADAYLHEAEQHGIRVIPAGLAFSYVRERFPEIELFSADIETFDENGKPLLRRVLRHPSLAGTYLAACVIYASLYGESPEGLPYRAGLSADIVSKLQQSAWAVVQQFLQSRSSHIK